LTGEKDEGAIFFRRSERGEKSESVGRFLARSELTDMIKNETLLDDDFAGSDGDYGVL
jgi:hypothetical protein